MNQDNGGIIGKINTPTTSLASGVWSLDSQFDSQAASIWPLAFPNTTIANSCRFNNGSSDYLSRTPSSAGNRNTWTWSGWIKKTIEASSNIYNHVLFGTAGSSYDTIGIQTTPNEPYFFCNIAGSFERTLNAKFRDVSAWYHLVVAFDSTQATASNRVKLYVNGVEQSSFSDNTNGSQNADSYINSTDVHQIGRQQTLSRYLNGYLCEVCFVDGQQLDATSFGAFNPVTNIWEPIAYAGTYGTNGFRLDFADSSALGNDVSGNDNDFTVNNLTSVDQSTDTCSNNFATFNSLDNTLSQFTFSQGNLIGSYSGSNGQGTGSTATFGLSQGKWYWELKYDSANDTPLRVGITDRVAVATSTTNRVGFGDNDFAYDQGDGKIYTDNDTGSSYGTSYAVGDIIGIALDLDNNKIYFSKNGTFQNSGNPAGNSNGFSITASSSITNGFYFPVLSLNSGSGVAQVSYNFGSPPFSISSGNADANGHGNFEYSVPSGFFSLCTKNLAEFG